MSAGEPCGICPLIVLPGGNHRAVNHPNGAATPWEWRPEEWRDNNVNREARRLAAAEKRRSASATSSKEPKSIPYTPVSSRRVAKREAW